MALVERRRVTEEQHAAPPVLLAHLVDHALETERHIDRLFWLSAAGDLIRREPTSAHAAGVRRIHAATRVPYSDPLKVCRFLAPRRSRSNEPPAH